MDKKQQQFEQYQTTTTTPNNNNNCINNFDDKNISKQEFNGHRNEMNRKDNENLQKDEDRKVFVNNSNAMSANNEDEKSNSNHIMTIAQQPQAFISSSTQNNSVDQLILPDNNLSATATVQIQSSSSPTNSNSTDNLSYNSDNNYIEELLLLQSTLSDDDANCQSINSDDCIYAYRGADLIDQLEQNHNNCRNSNIEDETDFLEMDFDPDPPSEEQNPNEIYQQREFEKEILLNEQRLNIENDILLNDITNNIQQTANNQITNITNNINKLAIINDNNEHNIIITTKNQNLQCNNDNNKMNEITNELNMKKTDNQHKLTGTKPKKVIENKYINGGGNTTLNNNNNNNNNSTVNKSRKQQQQKSNEFDKRNYQQNSIDLQNEKSKNKLNSLTIAAGDCNKESGDDIICLDCLEKEFLEKTVGKIIENNIECPKCKLKQRNPIMMYGSDGMGDSPVNNLHNSHQQLEQIKQQQQQQQQQQQVQSGQNQNLNNHHHHHKSSLSFDFINDLLTTKEFNNAIQRRASCDNISDNEMLLRITNKESSTFSSIDVDSTIIVQALEKLNISYDEQVLDKYFNENTRNNFIDVCDFILYSSKKNCNYKKIIKLIKLATKDQVNIKFNYDEKSSSFEVVQVKVYDIIQSWLHNNDLTNLKKLNKRFFEMNILGKIINLIRQAQQRITKQPFKEYILIPQYYKLGFITITKKN